MSVNLNLVKQLNLFAIQVMFAIVEFIGKNSVEIIHYTRFLSEEDKCVWPNNLLGTTIVKLVKKNGLKHKEWTEYQVRVLGKAGEYNFQIILNGLQ